jgi:hypothetical protein
LQAPSYYSYEQPFINRMLLAADWSQGGSYSVDAQGYPRNMGTNSKICTVMLYNYTNFTGQYFVIRYSGDGIHPISRAGTLAKLSYGTGTMTDTTPGRYVLRASDEHGAAQQLGICITSDDPDGTGNHIRNMAVIDCGANAKLGDCANENAWLKCTAPNKACLDPAWEKAFGTRQVGGPGFVNYRFMDWMNTNNVSDGSWSNRSRPDYFSYSSSHEKTGIPLEIIFSVMNQTCSDGWINIPAAGLTIITDATFTGSITNDMLSASNVSGKVQVGDYLTWSGGHNYGIHVTAILGKGEYRVSQSASQTTVPMTSHYLSTLYIQDMAAVAARNIRWCNSDQKLRIEVGNEPWNFTKYGYGYFGKLAQSLWGIGGVDGGYNFRGMITGVAGYIFKTIFGSQSSHIQSVLNIQGVENTYYATDGNKLLTAPYWGPVPAYHYIDAGAISEYYTIGEYNIPYGWTALPDRGLSKVLTELTQGGLVNNQISTKSSFSSQTPGSGYGSCGNLCGYVPVTGSGGQTALCDFQVTAGSLSCTPSNGGENFTVGTTLSVDNQYFGSKGSGWSAIVGNVTGADSTMPQISQAAKLTGTWLSYLERYGLKSFVYEGGEQILIHGGASPMKTLLCAWDTYSQAKKFTYEYIDQWRRIEGAGAVFNYYQDTSTCGYPSSWGLLYYPQSMTMPKYEGAIQEMHATP